MLLAVLIHETGHLILGLLTGYHFVSYKFLWLKLTDTGAGMKLNICGIYPLGQCLMYPVKSKADPKMLILGGPVFNLVFGILFIICGFTISKTIYGIIALYLGSMDITTGIYNLFLGSAYSDGHTFKEIKNDKESAHVYNNIMMIYRYLHIGTDYKDMPDHLFLLNTESSGSLYDEMKELKKRKEDGCSGKAL